GGKTALKPASTPHALRVHVNRQHGIRAEPHGREREQPAPAADVEKAQPIKRVALQHRAERTFRLANAVLIDGGQEPRPVLTELEAHLPTDDVLLNHARSVPFESVLRPRTSCGPGAGATSIDQGAVSRSRRCG